MNLSTKLLSRSCGGLALAALFVGSCTDREASPCGDARECYELFGTGGYEPTFGGLGGLGAFGGALVGIGGGLLGSGGELILSTGGQVASTGGNESGPGPCGSACSGETSFCDLNRGQCVQCLESAHCSNPSEPSCISGTCSPCTENGDCADVAGRNVCHLQTATCVACTIGNTESCGDFSCDLQSNTCTTTKKGSVGVCEPCRANSECKIDHGCAPVWFQGEPRGYTCLKLEVRGCVPPLTVATPLRVSPGGSLGLEYCGVNEDKTTCEAALDAAAMKICASPSDCGVAGLDDSVCTSQGVGTLICGAQ